MSSALHINRCVPSFSPTQVILEVKSVLNSTVKRKKKEREREREKDLLICTDRATRLDSEGDVLNLSLISYVNRGLASAGLDAGEPVES